MKPKVVGTIPQVFRQAWRWLARPAVLVALIVALLTLLALGTLLPQLPVAARDTAQLTEWRALAQARFGPLAPLLETIGAFRLYRSPLLWTLVALLAAATLSCTLQRWPGKWQSVFGLQARRTGNVAASAPPDLEGAAYSELMELPKARSFDGAESGSFCEEEASDPPSLDLLYEVARQAMVQHDYRVRGENMPDFAWLQGDRNRLSALGTLMDHLAVLIILAGVCFSTIFGWRETLTVQPGETVQVGHGRAVALRNEGFEIERYRDGSPAAYTAQVTIATREAAERRAIGVNRPASESGIRFYLQGYHPVESRYAVTLLAVYDPGFGVVVLGSLLFLAGILVALYFPRSSVTVKIAGPSGTLRLTGRADRRAYDFGRDFAALAADLRRDWKLEARS